MEIFNETDHPVEMFPLGLPGGDLYNVVTVKASFRIEKMRLVPDPEPFPVFSIPEEIDGRVFASDRSLEKEGVDFVFIGDAVAPGGAPVRHMNVAFSVGSEQRTLVVSGDRHWEKAITGYRATRPEPFTRMPLDWAHAYGGPSPDGRGNEIAFWHNPEGRGYIAPIEAPIVEGVRLPNIETPERQINDWTQQPDPSGCAFYPTHWGLRLKAGVEAREGQSPRILPAIFNQAHPDFVLKAFPSGQQLSITGMTGDPFSVILEAPELRVRIEGERIARPLSVRWDTVCVLPGAGRLYLVGRAGFFYDDEVLWDHVVLVGPKRKEDRSC